MIKQFFKLGLNLLMMVSMLLISCSENEGIESLQVEVESSSQLLSEIKSMEFPSEILERVSEYRANRISESEVSDKQGTVKQNKIIVPRDYSTIQEAIDAASPGDVVRVKDGDYSEDVIIHIEGVTLEAVGLNVNIYGSIGILNNGVTVAGFNIFEAELADVYMPSIIYSLGNIEWTADYLNGVKIINNKIKGKSIIGTATVAIGVLHVTGIEISKNSIENCNSGIFIGGAEEVILRDNKSHNNSNYGVALMEVNGGDFTGNSCNENRYGVVFQVVSSVLMSKNSGWGNSEYDFYVWKGCGVVDSKNDFEKVYIDEVDECQPD